MMTGYMIYFMFPVFYFFKKNEGEINMPEEHYEFRTCSECNENLLEGFVIQDGASYYCTRECLEKNMLWEDYLELYDDGETSTYWTEWYDEIPENML